MTPEEQNVATTDQKLNNVLQGRLSAFKQWKERTDAEYANQQSAKMENETMNLYKSWLEATDEKTKQKYSVASRGNLLAQMIKDAGAERGYEITWNAADIIWKYVEGFPDQVQALHNFTHSDQDPEEFAIQMGWMQAPEKKKTGILTNILGGVTESVLWIPKFAGKIWADLAWATIKAFWGDEERANAARDAIRGGIDQIWFGDEESTAYKAANSITDIGQLFIPWVWLVKTTEVATKFPVLAKYLAKWAKALEKSPTIAKLLKWSAQWAWDVIKYNAINQEYTTPGEMVSWGLLNIAFGKWGEVVSKVANTMWIKGLMTNAKARGVIEAIQKEWWKAGSVDDLANWFNARGFKWTTEEIVGQLDNWSTDAQKLKQELLATSKTRYESEETTWLLKKLEEHYSKLDGGEEKLAQIKKLLKKNGKYTASEMENAKNLLDGSDLNPYKLNEYGMAKNSDADRIMAQQRNKIKTQIEDIAKKEGLGDIKALNNEITVAEKMKNWIEKKSLAEEIKDWFKSYAIPWAVVGYLTEWDLEGMLKYAGWAYALKLLGNTAVRTYLSSAIQRLEGTERVALTKWLSEGGKTALTKSQSATLAKLLENADEWTRSEIVNTIVNYAKEWARLWTVVWGEELIDSVWDKLQ